MQGCQPSERNNQTVLLDPQAGTPMHSSLPPMHLGPALACFTELQIRFHSVIVPTPSSSPGLTKASLHDTSMAVIQALAQCGIIETTDTHSHLEDAAGSNAVDWHVREVALHHRACKYGSYGEGPMGCLVQDVPLARVHDFLDAVREPEWDHA